MYASLWNTDGNLPPGEHPSTWDELVDRFGWNPLRRKLLWGLSRALQNLVNAGCSRVFLDGSFVTRKETPSDYDGCWDTLGVDFTRLDPVFIDLVDLSPRSGRRRQKAKYGGELFPSHEIADPVSGRPYRQFFQYDRDDNPKGIVVINLTT